MPTVFACSDMQNDMQLAPHKSHHRLSSVNKTRPKLAMNERRPESPTRITVLVTDCSDWQLSGAVPHALQCAIAEACRCVPHQSGCHDCRGHAAVTAEQMCGSGAVMELALHERGRAPQEQRLVLVVHQGSGAAVWDVRRRSTPPACPRLSAFRRSLWAGRHAAASASWGVSRKWSAKQHRLGYPGPAGRPL